MLNEATNDDFIVVVVTMRCLLASGGEAGCTDMQRGTIQATSSASYVRNQQTRAADVAFLLGHAASYELNQQIREDLILRNNIIHIYFICKNIKE